MSRLWIALRTMIYVPLFLAAWGSVDWISRRLDRHLPVRIPGWLALPGIVLGAAGAVVALMTVGLFVVRGFGTPAIFDPPKKFVPHGPYRFVRNPMYLGGVSTLAGWGLYARSLSMVMYAVVAFLLIHTFVVLGEEPGLRKRFDGEYEAYCQTVPRWIPRFTKRGC